MARAYALLRRSPKCDLRLSVAVARTVKFLDVALRSVFTEKWSKKPAAQGAKFGLSPAIGGHRVHVNGAGP
jgi:hypothetical protein